MLEVHRELPSQTPGNLKGFTCHSGRRTPRPPLLMSGHRKGGVVFRQLLGLREGEHMFEMFIGLLLGKAACF